MIKKHKKILLTLTTFSSSIIPVTILTSCNIRTGRSIKDNELSDSAWESKNWKDLEKTIQIKFKNSIIRDMFTDYFFNNTNSSKKKWGLSDISKAKTEEQLSRVFLNKKGGVGNYASDTLESVFDEIRGNILIPKSQRLLLNKISTVYNRTINIFPIKTYIHEKNNNRYIHVEFRADLLTPMKRRFMRKFTELKFDFPIFKQLNSNDEYSLINTLEAFDVDTSKLNNVSEFAKNINSSMKMYLLLKSTIFVDDGLSKKGNGIIDISNAETLMGNKQLLNLNSGFYPLNANKNDLYIPNKTGKINSIQKIRKYSFANWHGILKSNGNISNINNHEFVELDAFDKVSSLENKIKETYFTNSKMPLFKSLFGPNGSWNIEVVARTWAGNNASNYSIADWVENIGHRGDFWFYIINKNDPTQSYNFKYSAGMVKVQEDV